MRHHKYPKTGRYSQAIKELNEHIEYQLASGNTTDYSKVYVRGTVKVHGSNVGISYDNGLIEVQSRNNKLSLQSDMAGVATWVTSNTTTLNLLFEELTTQLEVDFNTHFITIFGEWAGGNVQGGVAISGLDKFFVAFRVAVCEKVGVPDTEGELHYYAKYHEVDIIPTKASTLEAINFYTSLSFPTYSLVIDINNPQEAGTRMEELTLKVEDTCPVGEFFRGISEGGSNTIGEGIVWSTEVAGKVFRWKTKGTKHSKSKVKVQAVLDPEELANINNLIPIICPEWRMEQSISEQGLKLDYKYTGQFLGWVMKDIAKEESDRIEASGISTKKVNNFVVPFAKTWFFNKIRDI